MEVKKSLRPYQIEDVEFLTKNPCTGCFNEQRTGKTPTALMCIKKRKLEDTKVLVITTTSSIYQWQKEYTQWLDKPCVVVNGSPAHKKKQIAEWTNGLIISMGSFKETSANAGYIDQILKMKPTMVILDEAHQIRNPSTYAAKAAFRLTSIPIRMALTGTPAYGTAKDIFAILKFLFPDVYKSKYKFYEEYLKPEYTYIRIRGKLQQIVDYKYLKPDKEEKLKQFLSNYCTQRKRRDIMQWLPEKDKQIINLPLTAQQKRYLNELKDNFETEDVKTQGTLDRLIRYRQICLDPELLELSSKSPKTEYILDFIKDNPDTPILIFSNFTSYLKKLFKILNEKGIKEAMIVGEVSPEKRAQYQTAFQSGKFNVFLLNIMAAKEALTLDRAEAIIFTDVYPPIGAIEQAEDRFIATTEDKKDKPHTIYNLVMEGSFDETLLKLLQERKTETEIINNFKGGNYVTDSNSKVLESSKTEV